MQKYSGCLFFFQGDERKLASKKKRSLFFKATKNQWCHCGWLAPTSSPRKLRESGIRRYLPPKLPHLQEEGVFCRPSEGKPMVNNPSNGWVQTSSNWVRKWSNLHLVPGEGRMVPESYQWSASSSHLATKFWRIFGFQIWGFVFGNSEVFFEKKGGCFVWWDGEIYIVRSWFAKPPLSWCSRRKQILSAKVEDH